MKSNVKKNPNESYIISISLDKGDFDVRSKEVLGKFEVELFEKHYNDTDAVMRENVDCDELSLDGIKTELDKLAPEDKYALRKMVLAEASNALNKHLYNE